MVGAALVLGATTVVFLVIGALGEASVFAQWLYYICCLDAICPKILFKIFNFIVDNNLYVTSYAKI